MRSDGARLFLGTVVKIPYNVAGFARSGRKEGNLFVNIKSLGSPASAWLNFPFALIVKSGQGILVTTLYESSITDKIISTSKHIHTLKSMPAHLLESEECMSVFFGYTIIFALVSNFVFAAGYTTPAILLTNF